MASAKAVAKAAARPVLRGNIVVFGTQYPCGKNVSPMGGSKADASAGVFQNVRNRWWALMSCAAFTILGMWGLITNAHHDTLITESFVLAVIFVVIAAYLAWKDKYLELIATTNQIEILKRELQRKDNEILAESKKQTALMEESNEMERLRRLRDYN
jgi:hypothetical protein